MVSVFDYTDFHCFLKDKFSECKSRNPAFSYRFFNRLAGIQSSGFLKLVIEGKRNLGEEGIEKISRGFKLTEAEQVYFTALVKFNQAKNNEEKDRYFKILSNNKKFLKSKPLTAAQYQLFSHWYNVVILELVRLFSKEKKDLRWIQSQLNPPVELRKLKQGIEELKKLGLIGQRKDESLYRKDAMLSTEDEVHSLAIANFHVQLSELAARTVLKEPGDQREFSSLTIATSQEAFQMAKKEIQGFRKKLHSILEQEKGGPKTIVSQINFQLFNLSKG